MRLLERKSDGEFGLTEFWGDNIPRYAILSHTWGAEEVTFEDLMDQTGKSKGGFNKIRFCGEQAANDAAPAILQRLPFSSAPFASLTFSSDCHSPAPNILQRLPFSSAYHSSAPPANSSCFFRSRPMLLQRATVPLTIQFPHQPLLSPPPLRLLSSPSKCPRTRPHLFYLQQ